MKGEVVVLELIDVGGTLDLPTIRGRLEARHQRPAPAVGKRTPPYVEFPKPLVVRVESLPVRTPLGDATANVEILYFPIGAVSFRFRVPFETNDLAALSRWAESEVELGGKRTGWDAAARQLLERERGLWAPAVRDRYTETLLVESYTVFAFSDVGMDAQRFLELNRSPIAGLLKAEDGARLHEKEVGDALRNWFSYYSDDVVVIDWDAALIVDPSPEYEDLVFVLEIANLQLLEFRAYDDYLDDTIARGYDELGALFRGFYLFRSARKTAHDLSLLRMEIAELADEADNITKFLGDWFLARVYEAAQEKFHLPAWRGTVDEKLNVINKLYQLANDESDNRRLLTLEVLIVLLFVLDLLTIALK